MGNEQSSGGSDIVVVNEQTAQTRPHDPLSRLRNLTTFQPLLQHSAHYVVVPGDHAQLKQLNPQHLIELFTLYEEHLRQSASVVTTEQDHLSRSIRAMDVNVTQILGTTTKQNNSYTQWSTHIRSSVKDVSTSLTAIQKSVEGLVPLVNELNDLLPPQERLQPFTLSPGGSGLNHPS